MTMTKTKITREEVLSRYPWLTQRDLPMVTHNDFDGLLTAMILNEVLGWKLVGVNDLKTIHFTSTYTGKSNEPIYVDLDVTHKNYKSLGHHILGDDEGDHLNINRLFGIGYKQYTKKFPLSTAVFLFWLFDLDFNKLSDLAKLFLVHSDSMWKNYIGYDQRYRRNVTEWLERMDLKGVKDFLDQPNLMNCLEKYVFPHTYSRNKQCTYLAKNGRFQFRDSSYNVQQYVDGLCKIFHFQKLQMPTQLVQKVVFNRKEFTITNYNLEGTLQDVKSQHNVFSYSVKYMDKVDISYI